MPGFDGVGAVGVVREIGDGVAEGVKPGFDDFPEDAEVVEVAEGGTELLPEGGVFSGFYGCVEVGIV